MKIHHVSLWTNVIGTSSRFNDLSLATFDEREKKSQANMIPTMDAARLHSVSIKNMVPMETHDVSSQ